MVRTSEVRITIVSTTDRCGHSMCIDRYKKVVGTPCKVFTVTVCWQFHVRNFAIGVNLTVTCHVKLTVTCHVSTKKLQKSPV